MLSAWYNGSSGIVVLMSFFSKIISKVYESVVEDDFTQQLTEHEVLAVLNHQRSLPHQPPSHSPSSQNQLPILHMAQTISQFTPEIQFRLLGSDPSLQAVANRLAELKSKLQGVDSYLLQHYQSYLSNLSQSVDQLHQLKQFYCGRKRAQQARGAIERLRLGLDRARRITRLNIYLNNLKSTIKLLQKIPRIKNMTLMELKAIDMHALSNINLQTPSRLLCIDLLCNYINKVNNQQFVYIIDKIKLTFAHFQEASYQELVRTFLVINPSTPLHKLLCSLLEAQLRTIADVSVEKCEQINKITHNVVNITINLHKLIKWHKLNKAISTNQKAAFQSQSDTPSPQNDGRFNTPRLADQDQTRNRQLSADSICSEEGRSNIDVNDQIMIDPTALKVAFTSTLDSCLSELVQSSILSPDIELERFYQYMYSISRIAEVCYNFTGIHFEQLRSVISEYVCKRELSLFHKSSRELSVTLENERNQWNRLPFKNDYRYRNIDKLIYKVEKMRESQEFRRAEASISKMVRPAQPDTLTLSQLMEQYEEERDGGEWELKPIRLPSLERSDKQFQQWVPGPSYLQSYEGDVILSHSSLKILGAMQKHLELLIATGSVGSVEIYLQHLLLLIQYYVFYIFTAFLSPSYKRVLFDSLGINQPLDKRYTKQRLTFLYPQLSQFVVVFRDSLQKNNVGQGRLYVGFKREIKELTAQSSQALRAKVVATQSCKFALAYFQQILKSCLASQKNAGIYVRLERTKQLLKEVSLLVLTESSQKMAAPQLQAMKSVLQSVRWSEPFEELAEYVAKVVSLGRDSFERLKSSSRGQIPSTIVYRIFVLVWRTLVTFAIKIFLEGKSNNRAQNKRHFKMFISEMYREFQNPLNPQLRQLEPAYKAFLSIFDIIESGEGEQSRKLLLQTLKRYEYIFAIVMALLQNCQYMQNLTEGEKQAERYQFKNEFQYILSRQL